MLYVSLASISTLRNSDIPVTFLARQLAAIEAITGQLYLAVLIARLVGFSIAGPISNPSDYSRRQNPLIGPVGIPIERIQSLADSK